MPVKKAPKGTAPVGEVAAVKARVTIKSGAPIDVAALNAAATCPAASPQGGMAAALDSPVAAP